MHATSRIDMYNSARSFQKASRIFTKNYQAKAPFILGCCPELYVFELRRMFSKVEISYTKFVELDNQRLHIRFVLTFRMLNALQLSTQNAIVKKISRNRCSWRSSQ